MLTSNPVVCMADAIDQIMARLNLELQPTGHRNHEPAILAPRFMRGVGARITTRQSHAGWQAYIATAGPSVAASPGQSVAVFAMPAAETPAK